MTEDQVRGILKRIEFRRLTLDAHSNKALARDYGTTVNTIRKIQEGKKWKSLQKQNSPTAPLPER